MKRKHILKMIKFRNNSILNYTIQNINYYKNMLTEQQATAAIEPRDSSREALVFERYDIYIKVRKP